MKKMEMQRPVGECSVCDSTAGFDLIHENCEDFEYMVKGSWKYWECRDCGTWVIDPLPTKIELIDYYPPNYHSYGRPKSGLVRQLWRLVLRQKGKKIHKLIGNHGKFLDVGCADGFVIRELEKLEGWRGYGIELNDDIAKMGRAKGTEIQSGMIEDATFPDNFFDLIIMNHLLEHVTEPRETMLAAKRLLKPGGFILGEMPNTSSWDAAISGRYWGGLHAPRHLYLMNKLGARALADECGFEVVSISASPHTGHWAGSVQNRLHRTRHGEGLTYGRDWYFPFLLCLFLPINILQALLLKTGILCFVLKKPKE